MSRRKEKFQQIVADYSLQKGSLKPPQARNFIIELRNRSSNGDLSKAVAGQLFHYLTMGQGTPSTHNSISNAENHYGKPRKSKRLGIRSSRTNKAKVFPKKGC